MMDINEICQFEGRTISRYEWNRLNENLGCRFSVYQSIENGIMHTLLRQVNKIDERGHLRPIPEPMHIRISLFVRWNDLYKRKLLLIKRKT